MTIRRCKPVWAALGLGFLSGCARVEDGQASGAGEALHATHHALTVSSFDAVHRNALPGLTSGCDDRPSGIDRQLWGIEPDAAGTYPVFMYFVGWGGSHLFHTAQTVVQQMASKGFVAATIGYTNAVTDAIDCIGTEWKAYCAFDRSLSGSAVSQLCSRPKADCSKGIVVMGHSLGGGVAIVAKNYNSNVQAVVSIGAAEQPLLGSTECFRPFPSGQPPRALPNSRHLALAGQVELFGMGPPALDVVTGLSCGTGFECAVNPAEPMPTAGWLRVPNARMTDGLAGHCYMLVGNAWSPLGYNDYCLSETLEPNWAPPAAYPWSLVPTLNWLKRFVTP